VLLVGKISGKEEPKETPKELTHAIVWHGRMVADFTTCSGRIQREKTTLELEGEYREKRGDVNSGKLDQARPRVHNNRAV